jgi:Xaa-Pro aminopeptidase
MIPQMLALMPNMPEEGFPWIRDIRPGTRGSMIVETLQQKGLERSRVGVVGLGGLRIDWEGWIPFKTWERVLKSLPDCAFSDVTRPFAEWILVKSKEEVILVRRAAQVLEQTCEEMLAKVCAGVGEEEIYAVIQRVLQSNGIYEQPLLILRSGPTNPSWGQPSWYFGIGSPRVLEPGDVLQAEIGAWCGGLEAQVQMSVAIPPISSPNTECGRLARQVYEEGLSQLRPGKKFAEVVVAMEAILDRPGIWHLTPLIHSMNPMACTGPTAVRIDSLRWVQPYGRLGTGHIRGGDVILEPGMVFELEPNACFERYRVNIGGTVVVTENGSEPLNEIPTQMRTAGESI